MHAAITQIFILCNEDTLYIDGDNAQYNFEKHCARYCFSNYMLQLLFRNMNALLGNETKIKFEFTSFSIC